MATNFSNIQIAVVISNLVEDYKERFPHEIKDAHDINGGFCFHFAMRLRDLLGHENCIIVDTCGDNSHSFVFSNGHYYDSEAPNGVQDYKEMPYFKYHGENIKVVFSPDPLHPEPSSWRACIHTNGAAYANGWVREEEEDRNP
jgi:hypothetical protein